MQLMPFETILLVENFRSPAIRLRGGYDLAQHSVDVNRLAVVAAVIFAKLLHAENLTQSRQDAKKFLTRISRINTDV